MNYKHEGAKIFFNEDVPYELRRRQAEIRRIANEERNKGKTVKVDWKLETITVDGNVIYGQKEDTNMDS
jgi:hypothetical protein